jgi:hypothetical protein
VILAKVGFLLIDGNIGKAQQTILVKLLVADGRINYSPMASADFCAAACLIGGYPL